MKKIFTFLILLVSLVFLFSGCSMFVDTNSLVPNKLELDNNLRGDIASSSIFSKDYVILEQQNKAYIDFKYNGAGRMEAFTQDSIIKSSSGKICKAEKIINNDLQKEGKEQAFISGQSGTIIFNCETLNLEKGDSFKGEIVIKMKNLKETDFKFSKGEFSLKIN